uniref:Zinc finger, CCHC-type n=1 Tax=Tanacetum cinerariifolium TaxID=118510 RepID=A0A6L2L026_TANCI|nr:zinc finger, CCHC-type [Tanacetum cinerariifolium]
MVGNDANNDRVEQLKNSLKQFRKTIENSLQQITQTLTTLTTHENDERHNRGGPILSRGHGMINLKKNVFNRMEKHLMLKMILKKNRKLEEDGSISTWEDLTTHFLSQLFLSKRIVKLQNDILMLQQPQVQIFYDNIDYILKRIVDYTAEGRLRKYVCGITSDMMRQLPPEPSRQEAFEDLVMNFILNQEDKVKQLEEYMSVIGSDFTQLSLVVIVKLKEEIRMEENRAMKIKKSRGLLGQSGSLGVDLSKLKMIKDD